nr:reverse transcriptase domain-containing protein [Tanacetum cinerariifolium]
ISNCTAENQVKLASCTLIGSALTWWNSHIRAVSQEVAYAIPWKTLKQMMTTKYCPRDEVKKLEVKLWNLKDGNENAVARAYRVGTAGGNPDANVVMDETAFLTGDVRYGKTFPTITRLDAGQDRENIAKTSAMPHEASPMGFAAVLAVLITEASQSRQHGKSELILSSCSSGKSSTMAKLLSSVDISSGNIYTNSKNIL